MLYGRYTFKCIFRTYASLPFYKGSTLRGALGHALKKAVCIVKKKECGECLLKSECIYIKFFAPYSISIPNTFVIEPPLDKTNEYREDDELIFDILIFGGANEFLPYIIYAIKNMGEKIGIGKKIEGERAKFHLESVRWNNRIIYSSKTEKFEFIKDLPDINLSETENIDDKEFSIKITIETPLRIKVEDHFQSDIPFHVLTRAMLRRASSLLEHYGALPDIDYKKIINDASDIKTAEYDITWRDWRRYSNRQKQGMLFGGITGSITYEGMLAKFIPLIRFSEKVHLGKQTSFGLGKLYAVIV